MATDLHREPWNKGIIVGQKAPLKLREVWAIRMRLQRLIAHANSRCSIWVWTASCEPAT
jgi:hypothetical protein